MNKLKAIAATLLAASAIGVGSLVAAPTASALPTRCVELSTKSVAYYNAGMVLEAYGHYNLASYYYGKSAAYAEMAVDCFRGL
jgi:hypothetical protein